MRTTMLWLVLTVCGTASAPPASLPLAVSSSTLRWELIAQPDHLAMGDRDAFRIRRQVTNVGTSVADPSLASPLFLVDGEESLALGLAFGNGRHDERWSALAPGETTSDERGMGTTLFPAPGTYELAMTVDGVTSTARVQVDP